MQLEDLPIMVLRTLRDERANHVRLFALVDANEKRLKELEIAYTALIQVDMELDRRSRITRKE